MSANNCNRWAMTISLFYFTFWSVMRGANFTRPSALQRGYVNIWLFILGWAALVAVSVTEDRLKLGSGYPLVFFQSAVCLSTLLTLIELFALPKKTTWGQQVREDHEARDLFQSNPNPRPEYHPSQLPPIPPQEALQPPRTRDSNASTVRDDDDSDTEGPTERTPLMGGNATGEHFRTTFATTYRRSITALVNGARKYSYDGDEPFDHEQGWSGHMPSWVWFFQFLILGPFIITLAAQTGLMLVDAVHQTGADGSNLLMPYLVVFGFSVLLLLPLAPFIHRITHHIPIFLLVVFIAALIFNLAAFPFSESSRYKVYWRQTIEIGEDSSNNNKICYTGIEEYLHPIIAEMPSSFGKEVTCEVEKKRTGTRTCCYDGSSVVPNVNGNGETDFDKLVSVHATRGEGNKAQIGVNAKNTKACFLEFKTPISGFHVHGSSGWDDRFGQYPEAGIQNLKLWRRDWEKEWVVDVEWKDEKSGGGDDDEKLEARDSGLEGTVVCMWSDANIPGTIPALDEALKFSPTWAAITKFSEGLVEGRRAFSV